KGVQRIVLALRDGVVLVAVALRTADGHSEPNSAERVGAIDRLLDAVLFGIGAPFGVVQRITMQSGGNALFLRSPWPHVTSKLLDRELIKRQIGIECGNPPVPKAKCERPRAIFLVTVAVSVTGQVEPVPPPAFTKMGRGEKPIDQPARCIRTRVG